MASKYDGNDYLITISCLRLELWTYWFENTFFQVSLILYITKVTTYVKQVLWTTRGRNEMDDDLSLQLVFVFAKIAYS